MSEQVGAATDLDEPFGTRSVVIEVTGLRKRFGQVQAVDHVSFQAADGCVTGLLGPNGAGKTTTLRMLSGLMSPDAGTIRVDTIDVTSDPVGARRLIGMLPESRGLYPRLTPREQVEYFGRLHGVDTSTLGRRREQLFADLGLEEMADRSVRGFSQGERAKVALARALIHQPQNVILDEPTNGLDVSSTRTVRELIRGLRQRGCCVVFSSHVMQEVSALCDRVVIIARGETVSDGPPQALLEQTGRDDLEDAFVALLEEQGKRKK